LPDGRLLITGGWDGPARLWRTELDDLVAFAREQLPRDLTAEERLKCGLEAP